ncbi:MAG: putative glycolipid-binding domain-containing protein [Gemmatimonadaceae bacterium]
MTGSSILWRRLDRPGHESARLAFEGSAWRLTGSAVFAHESHACRLSYTVGCDARWHTVLAKVDGWIGERIVEIALTVDDGRLWRMNDVACPEVSGCVDVDLNFSPSTNTLPIRRLNLAVGEEAPVHAAWLRFPEFTLERLDQVYRRTGEKAYRYESGGGAFSAEVEVNEAGLVTRYPGLWREER